MWTCAAIVLLAAAGGAAPADSPDPVAGRTLAAGGAVVDDALEVAACIDELAAAHWQAQGIHPAALVGDAGFLRRATLDLAGRSPTMREAQEFAADTSSDKRQRAIRRLLDSPEYPLHFACLLDEWLQGRYAGNGEFLNFLRQAMAERTPWDQVFQQVLLGPFDTPQGKQAAEFLKRRVNNLDELTNDTARVFFGVNISCAKCHDHPLVDDWKQEHYYGLASFLSRTHELSDMPLPLGERDAGEVTFIDTGGQQHAARAMFLGGQLVDDPKLGLDPRLADRRKAALEQKQYLPPLFSLREQLVRVALEERTFFSRAAVNQVWRRLLGRGLVHPVDQMHAENPSSIPGLLEYLADDLAGHGYNLDRLVAGIVLSRVYQLSGERTSAAEPPAAEHFARALLRPLSAQQYVASVLVATGDGSYDQLDAAARRQRYLEFQNQAQGWKGQLDQGDENFQSSVAEALFVSNHPQVQALAGGNLAARLASLNDNQAVVETAAWSVLCRPAESEELAELAAWLERPGIDRRRAVGDLVWAFLASAEFRFNH